MLRKSRSVRVLDLRVAAVFLGLLAAAFPGLTLFSGQVIKQFETYSLAQSMARVGWNPFATTIPCDGGIRWVLELPIFAGLGGIFAKAAPAWPSILPVLVFWLFLWALVRFRERFAPDSSHLVWIAVAATPVFLRFSTQFLADPFAVALLLVGAGVFLEGRRALAALVFMLAVSVKPTVLPSVLFFRWAFAPERDARKILPAPFGPWLVREGSLAVAFATPFLAWTLSVKWLGIPSPMHAGGLLDVGSDWRILGEARFYSKFFVWTVFKGVGIPLAICALAGLRYAADRVRRLAAWSAGIFPYWLVVRHLNVIHDYYSLSFFLPIALLGAFGAEALAERKPVAIRYLRPLLLVGIFQGVGLFIQSGTHVAWHPPVESRPIFCGKEMRGESLMGIPAAP
jgi:hypothetical protein